MTPPICSIWRRAITLVCVSVASVGVGCSGERESDSSNGLTSSAERDGAKLSVSVPTSELRTVDRLATTITATAPEGSAVREITFDAGTSGWTVVEQSPTQRRTDSLGRAVRIDRYLLEPFLDGAYTIPEATATFAAPGAVESTELVTTPLDVTVTSVLNADASIEDLAPPTGPVSPPTAEATGEFSLWVVGLATIGLIGCVLVVVLVKRTGRQNSGPHPVEQIEGLREDVSPEARDRLAAVLRGARNGQSTPALESLIDRLDRERYAPPGRSHTHSIEEDIDEALQVLGARAGGSA